MRQPSYRSAAAVRRLEVNRADETASALELALKVGIAMAALTLCAVLVSLAA